MIIPDIEKNTNEYKNYLEIRKLVKHVQRGDDTALSELVNKAQAGDKEAFNGIADILLPKLVLYFLSKWSSLVMGETRNNPDMELIDEDEAVSYMLLSDKPQSMSELVIGTLENVAKGLPGFRTESNLWTWVERIARHVAIDYGRAKKRLMKWEIEQAETEAYLDRLNEKRAEDGEEPIFYDQYVSSLILADPREIEKRVLFLKTVYTTQGLTRDDQEILKLFYGDKYTIAEIAEDLGKNESAIKMQKARAICILKGSDEFVT